MNTTESPLPVAQRIADAKASEYPTVLVCMIDEMAREESEGAMEGVWRVGATFLESRYRVYFKSREVLDQIKSAAGNLGRDDKDSCMARVVALRGIPLPSDSSGNQAFYAQELAA